MAVADFLGLPECAIGCLRLEIRGHFLELFSVLRLHAEILPKYAVRYLARRSQENTMLEGDGAVPCCIAILEFPRLDAVKTLYDSPENQEVGVYSAAISRPTCP